MLVSLRHVALLLLFCCASVPMWAQNSVSGVLAKQAGALEGYTFIAPNINTKAYAIDNHGRVIQEWDVGTRTREIHLLESGNVVIVKGPREPLDTSLIGLGYPPDGSVAEYTWEGELLWEYTFDDRKRRHHHGIDILPNGNILALVWDYHRLDDAAARGLRPDIIASSFEESNHFLPDSVLEINPASGEIVWEWRAWDHLVQNTAEEMPNFGDPSAQPQRLDINYEPYFLKGISLDFSAGPEDWMHSNAVNYNPALDQIVISVLRFDEFWIFDHSHNTETTAGPAGDLLYRWGNPFAYGQGDMADDRMLHQQHDAQWIDAGLPGAGNILIYNNRNNVLREDEVADDEYSSVLEVRLPLREDGSYNWAADAEVVWQYDKGFYSRIISGVQRLPNGNTLITEGTSGRLIEVTAAGEVVWEFISPINEENRYLFRARKYAADHPGFVGKELRPGPMLGAS